MKQLFFSVLFSGIFIAGAQNYSAIGYSPRILIHDNLAPTLSLYESSLSSVSDPLEGIGFLNGFTLERSWQPYDMVYDIGTDYSFAKNYGKGIHPTAGVTTSAIRYTYLDFMFNAGYPVFEKGNFMLVPGMGADILAVFIDIDIVNNGFYGEYEGPAQNYANGGLSIFCKALYAFSYFTAECKPFFTLYVINTQYDGLYEYLSNDLLTENFDRRPMYAGLQLMLGLEQ